MDNVRSTPDRLALEQRWRLVVGYASAVFVLDLLTKFLALVTLSPSSRPLLGPLKLQLAYNPGDVITHHPLGALTIIGSHLLLAALVAFAVVVLPTRRAVLAAGLILGGLVGNWLDLLVRPHLVIDFVGWGQQLFNLADLAAAVGVLLLLVEVAARLRRTPALAAA